MRHGARTSCAALMLAEIPRNGQRCSTWTGQGMPGLRERPMTRDEACGRINAFHELHSSLVDRIYREELTIRGGKVDPEEQRIRNELNALYKRQGSGKVFTAGYDHFDHSHQEGESWEYADGHNVYGGAAVIDGIRVRRIPSQTEEMRREAERLLAVRLEDEVGEAWAVKYVTARDEAERLSMGLARLDEECDFFAEPNDEQLSRLLGMVPDDFPVAAGADQVADFIRRREANRAERAALAVELEQLVRALRADGMGAPKVAKMLGVTTQAVYYAEQRGMA
jgi:hypothetical protein